MIRLVSYILVTLIGLGVVHLDATQCLPNDIAGDQTTALFQSPLIEVLHDFGFDFASDLKLKAVLTKPTPAAKCFASLSPDLSFSPTCEIALENSFGKDGFLTYMYQLDAALLPLYDILTSKGQVDEIFQRVYSMLMKVDNTELQDRCTNFAKMLPCINGIFESFQSWIKDAGECCHEFTDMMVPTNMSWSEVLSELTSATYDLTCKSAFPCAVEDSKKAFTCGYHLSRMMMKHVKADDVSQDSPVDVDTELAMESKWLDFLSIPEGEQTCKALTGKPFKTKSGKKAQLFNFGKHCSHHFVKWNQVVREVPLVEEMLQSLASSQCNSYFGSSKCFNIPASLDVCKWDMECYLSNVLKNHKPASAKESTSDSDGNRGNNTSQALTRSSAARVSGKAFLWSSLVLFYVMI